MHLHLRGIHDLHVHPLVLIGWLIIPSNDVLLFEPFELLQKAHLILGMCPPMRRLDVFHHYHHLLIALIDEAFIIRLLRGLLGEAIAREGPIQGRVHMGSCPMRGGCTGTRPGKGT